jgi:cyclic beta-1,2-glucan synthetase
LLGQAEDRDAALDMVRRFQQAEAVENAWTNIQDTWKKLVSTVQVHTPDPAMDLVLNGWLFYEALACRIWGRSAFYQSSGAYGFRDQLQDVMAMVFAAPDVAREHLLRSAGRQFELGDVLHWWHPPSGRGVRTRFSDDLLWLPYVAADYVRATQDDSVLDEMIPFLKGPPLKPEQDENYGQFSPAAEECSLYEHCRRAIERGSTRGSHGLPLMGSGDWNDGMNRVGNEGQGESVWLAWFLIDTLRKFAEVCDRRGDGAQANVYRQRASDYAEAVEQHAWDGEWYRRAYYDDGTPLGSSQNRECQIDSIAQSWAILSAAGNPQREQQAMQSLVQRLVRPQDRLMLLFAPPFDRTPRDPGYIKGYPPGVRENGGQYTHAAVWTVWALAQLGDGRQAHELFSLLNPIYHADTPEKVERYMVEPYVVAADVYGAEPHTGRGGWTWYTGSAGWMYRLGVEAILGLHREGGYLRIDPCIPPEWPGFTLTYRDGETTLEIQVDNPQKVARGVAQVMLDGKDLPDKMIPLLHDGQEHTIRVILGT